MSSAMYVIAALLAVLAPLRTIHVVAYHGDDFGFDAGDDLQVEFSDSESTKLWENKEISAIVGRTFHLVVPKVAFGQNAESYEAKRRGGNGLPSWLLFDKTAAVLWGIPLTEDVGTIQVSVRATGMKSPTEELTINVVNAEKETDAGKCPKNEDRTVLTLLIDKNVRAIKPKQRMMAVNNVAKFFGLPYSAFTLKPQVEADDINDSSVVLAGPGNIKSRTSKSTSLLQVPVGCDGRLWESTVSMVHQLKQQARDGTIAEVMRLPLVGWRVKTETVPIVRTKRQTFTPDLKSDNIEYGSGDIDSSGDYDEEYYEEEDYDDDYDGGVVANRAGKVQPTTASTTTSTTTEAATTHPHRHHHGEVKNETIPRESVRIGFPDTTIPIEPTSTSTMSTTSSTQPPTTASTKAATTTEASKVVPTFVSANEYDYDDEDDDDYNIDEGITEIASRGTDFQTGENDIEGAELTTEAVKTTKQVVPEVTVAVSSSTSTTSTRTTTTTTEATTTSTTTTPPPPTTTFNIVVDTEPAAAVTTDKVLENEPSETVPTVPSTSLGTEVVPEQTTVVVPSSSVAPVQTATPETEETVAITNEPTTVYVPSPSTAKSTTEREVTETIEYGEKNFKPYIENRLKQMSVIAGKIFRFVIPKDTFKDFEDNYDLSLQFLDALEQPITNSSWCQFNPTRREVYGLPLEEDVSKWTYYVRAVDRDGAYEQDKLNIQVQQHKLDRVMNHEFSLQIRIEKQQEFPHYIDWSLKVLRALGKVYNTNMSEITVRHINYTNEPVTFTWANDSIPTNYCPRSDIEQLYKTLTANDRGDPSRDLATALSPELRVKRVLYKELGVCEQQAPTPVTPPQNFSPILRNPVDNITATVGELLVYKVKDDTFYDPEDVDPRALNISLLTGDRQAIPSTNWLQFDSKNREFYGIPRKAGRSEYQLVCVDSGGLPATDSLEVVVYPAPKKLYNVEFSMTILVRYETFTNSASMQKKFVEKLRDLFGDTTTNSIHMNPFKTKNDSTIVTWYNKTLPVDRCAHDDISHLESFMKSDRSISYRVHSIMEPDFPVSTIKLLLLNNCKAKGPVHVPPPPEAVPPIDESSSKASHDEYLVTFIVPAIIICVMLFLASIAACVLYRRRRTGKMNVEEDGRQSYGNKGIPVIFQEELEEKPEPGTKTPVILKDEKPPLAPPEYSKSGSVKLSDDSEPYQPPPPFTRNQDNGRQARPKPTPTYRKPPPYVPP